MPLIALDLLLQPVVAYDFTTDSAKPPMNEPQVTPAALNRSPMFLLPMVTWLRVGLEQTSPIGSGSPVTVSEPSLPPITSSPVPLRLAVTPFVCPETRFINPGIYGPKVVL